MWLALFAHADLQSPDRIGLPESFNGQATIVQFRVENEGKEAKGDSTTTARDDRWPLSRRFRANGPEVLGFLVDLSVCHDKANTALARGRARFSDRGDYASGHRVYLKGRSLAGSGSLTRKEPCHW